MLIALIDNSSMADWKDDDQRLSSFELACRRQGHETILIDAGRQKRSRPILAAHGREQDIKPLIDSAGLVPVVRDLHPDICVVTLGGGLAHGLLMARCCGELPQDMNIMIVAEEPSRRVALRSDLAQGRLRPLVADAMERFCLERADLILTTTEDDLSWLGPLEIVAAPVERCLERPIYESLVIAMGRDPTDLCFVGPFERFGRVHTFIAAAEHLFESASTSLQRVTFIGPIDDGFNMIGKEWLGRRAINWPFKFDIVPTNALAEAVSAVTARNSLAYFPRVSEVSAKGIESRARRSIRFANSEGPDAGQLAEKLMTVLSNDTVVPPSEESAQTFLRMIAAQTRSRRGGGATIDEGLSICILHKDRPGFLRQAIDSVLDQVSGLDPRRVELIVFDNGSASENAHIMLNHLTALPGLSLIRQAHALPHPAAMNAMAANATKSYLVFLDDDNLLAKGGLSALFRACSAQCFDVIASNLLVFDHGDRPPEPAAMMAFIGPARTAGLFFNGFGDTCMAIRRQSFEALGGFLDKEGPSPAPDWLLLARAQAAGQRIGVLQEPAFLYRRDIEKADLSWLKYDQHGLRDLLLRHYGDRFDPALLAKLLQGLMVDFI